MAIPLAVLYRNLAAVHRAGIPWPQALEAASAEGPRWDPVREALSRGESVSKAFAGAVPPLDLAALRAAEASGRFEDVLQSLSQRYEEETIRSRARRAAAMYPMLLAHVAAMLLPLPDWMAGNTLRGLGWTLLVLSPVYFWLFLSIATRRAAEREPEKLDQGFLARFKSKAFVEEADARALRALGWLHEAGLPYTEAIPLAARAGAGGRVAHDLADGATLVRAGSPLSGGWRRVPDSTRSLLSTGEATGTLTSACTAAATEFESSADARRKRFASWAPQALMLAIGAVIAVRVIGFYAGIFNYTKGFR